MELKGELKLELKRGVKVDKCGAAAVVPQSPRLLLSFLTSILTSFFNFLFNSSQQLQSFTATLRLIPSAYPLSFQLAPLMRYSSRSCVGRSM